MPKNEISRAEKAGAKMGEAIIENVNLLYQNNTARNYLNGLLKKLNEDNERRNKKECKDESI